MNPDLFRILGNSGSLRRGSLNRALLRAAQDVAPDGVVIDVFDLADLPFYNGDVEAAGTPPPVRGFKDAIRAADAVLFATPEYYYSVPGVLKNAIDWAAHPSADNALRSKSVAVTGVAPGPNGTVRAQLALRQILLDTRSPVLIEPELMVGAAREKFDSDGSLHDPVTRERLHALISALVAWTNRVRANAPAADLVFA